MRAGYDFIGKGVARAAGAVAQRVAALNHEILDDPVKLQAVIEPCASWLACAAQVQGAFGQADKVDDRQRRLLIKKIEEDFSLIGGDFGIQAILQLFFLFLGHEFFSVGQKACEQGQDENE